MLAWLTHLLVKPARSRKEARSLGVNGVQENLNTDKNSSSQGASHTMLI